MSNRWNEDLKTGVFFEESRSYFWLCYHKTEHLFFFDLDASVVSPHSRAWKELPDLLENK